LYEAAKQRTQSVKGRIMKRKRSSTVEPVWGTLMNFMAAKRINARGLPAANKVVIMAAACYNLKKWMKFIITKAKSNAAVMTKPAGKAFAHFLKNFFIYYFKPVTDTFYFYQSTISAKYILLKRFYCLNSSIY
jgi:Transposase DDE domain